jgi:hypothetical protein
MERQAGLGRSLGDVFDSLPPVEPTDPAPNHALFGIAPDDAPVANGTSHLPAGSTKQRKGKGNKQKADKKKKKKKKKSKGKKHAK